MFSMSLKKRERTTITTVRNKRTQPTVFNNNYFILIIYSILINMHLQVVLCKRFI